MLLFDNPKSYTEMTKKISSTVLVMTFLGLMLVSHISTNFGNAMKSISLGIVYEYNGMKLYVAFFYIPILIGIFENMFHLHDKISDIFGIRYRYDKNVIIKRFVTALGFPNYFGKVNRRNRNDLMREVF